MSSATGAVPQDMITMAVLGFSVVVMVCQIRMRGACRQQHDDVEIADKPWATARIPQNRFKPPSHPFASRMSPVANLLTR